jgi:broad specificity phosphatase PhoE
MTTRVLFVRHGATDAVGKVLAGRSDGYALNADGREEADTLADHLAEERVDAVTTSPMERALETAARIAAPHTLPVCVDDALHEVDWGRWSGRTFDSLRDDPAWIAFHRARPCTPPPGGEHLVAVQDRLVRWLAALRDDGRTVVAVSHADPIRVALLHLLGASWEQADRLEIPTASVSAVELTSSGPRVLYVGRTAPARALPVAGAH